MRSSSETPELTIGEVARRSGMSHSRIRYYERMGLIEKPARDGGWRRYDEDVVRWLALIEVASELGFSLGEIRSLIEGMRGEGFDSSQRGELVRRKIEEAKEMAERAQTMQRLLEDCLSSGCVTLEGEQALDSCLAHCEGRMGATA